MKVIIYDTYYLTLEILHYLYIRFPELLCVSSEIIFESINNLYLYIVCIKYISGEKAKLMKLLVLIFSIIFSFLFSTQIFAKEWKTTKWCISDDKYEHYSVFNLVSFPPDMPCDPLPSMQPYCDNFEAKIVPQNLITGPKITQFLYSFENEYLSSNNGCKYNTNLNISKDSFEKIWNADDKMITKVINIGEKEKSDIELAIKSLKKIINIQTFTADTIIRFGITGNIGRLIKTGISGYKNFAPSDWPNFESKKREPIDKLYHTLAKGGKLIKTASIDIVNDDKYSITQNVFYNVQMGEENLTINLRSFYAVINCLDLEGNSLNCFHELPYIEIDHESPLNTYTWNIKILIRRLIIEYIKLCPYRKTIHNR